MTCNMLNPTKPSGSPIDATNKTFAEFFAGIGLVGEALRPSGWTCVYANDIDPGKQELYKARNGPSPHYHLEDVRQTAAVLARIPGRPDLAAASFPCTDTSGAGGKRGIHGPESSTFFAFATALTALGHRIPPMVMLENVEGFFTANQGDSFKAAAQTLAGLGYWLDAFVLDARHFLPQSRKRVFVVGVRDERRPAGRAGAPPASVLRPARLRELLGSVQLPTGWLNLALPDPPECGVRLEDLIDFGADQPWWEEDLVAKHLGMMSSADRTSVDALLAKGGRHVATVFRRTRGAGAAKRPMAEVRVDGVAGCLRAASGGSSTQMVLVVDGGRVKMRLMTALEYARLQGAPDFPMRGGVTQLRNVFGDAVCVPAVRWIDEHVLTPLYAAAVRPRQAPSAG